jgi:hypothetical protein
MRVTGYSDIFQAAAHRLTTRKGRITRRHVPPIDKATKC